MITGVVHRWLLLASLASGTALAFSMHLWVLRPDVRFKGLRRPIRALVYIDSLVGQEVANPEFEPDRAFAADPLAIAFCERLAAFASEKLEELPYEKYEVWFQNTEYGRGFPFLSQRPWVLLVVDARPTKSLPGNQFHYFVGEDLHNPFRLWALIANAVLLTIPSYLCAVGGKRLLNRYRRRRAQARRGFPVVIRPDGPLTDLW
jgi:hypothetical protein